MNISVLQNDGSFTGTNVIDFFESFVWTDRYQLAGDFELYMAMDQEVLQFIKLDNYLSIPDSEHTMIIEDLSIESDSEDGNKLIVTGKSLESILNRRVVQGQIILKGNFQNEIQRLLNENIISPSDSKRQISNFIFSPVEDPRITVLEIDTEYTGTDLYDIVTQQCVDKEIGFKIVLDEQNRFVFSLYKGFDRSYAQNENTFVIFSPNYENIINSNYYNSNGKLKNAAFILGEEDTETNTHITATIGDLTGLSRRELFTDARDISDTLEGGEVMSPEDYLALILARGQEQLSDYKIQIAFDGEAETTQSFVYGVDFFIGDTVQIENEYGHNGTAFISELIITEDSNGRSAFPTFTTINDDDIVI